MRIEEERGTVLRSQIMKLLPPMKNLGQFKRETKYSERVVQRKRKSKFKGKVLILIEKRHDEVH